MYWGLNATNSPVVGGPLGMDYTPSQDPSQDPPGIDDPGYGLHPSRD